MWDEFADKWFLYGASTDEALIRFTLRSLDILVISNRRGAIGEPPRGMWAAQVTPKVDDAKVAEVIERVRAKIAAKKAGNDAA